MQYSAKNLDDGLTRQNSHDYVLVLSKTAGVMRVTYFMVDTRQHRLLPKPCVVKWPRLNDLVDFRACVMKNCLYIVGGREKSTGR